MHLPQIQERYTLKSFTRNLPNPNMQAQLRLEALFKKEMAEHKHDISSHNKEMQSLKDSVCSVIEKLTSLCERNAHELKEFKDQALYSHNLLKEKVKVSEGTIATQKQTIEDLHAQILNISAAYATKQDLENVKKESDQKFNYATISQLNSFQDCQRELTILIQEVKNDLLKLEIKMEQKLASLGDRGDQHFSLAMIDKDSVLKEVRIYKKDMFVIEKKIENIYTLIERINKRGEVCHKQA